MNQNAEKRNEQLKRWMIKLALVLFDIFAVNFSYYIALVIRFYVNHEFHAAWNLFQPLFIDFAPYYTVCCVIVFAAFKLYNGMWRYAGLSDINRVAGANAVTCLIQVLGSILFVRRMPITYYVLGTLIQFVLICASRFSYRILAMELSHYVKNKNASVNVMLIGAGESARMLLRQLESDQENVVHPVCVVDYRNLEDGRLFNGLPVIGSLEGMREAVEKYKIQGVIIADPLVPQEKREKIKALCKELGIGVQDYFGFSLTASFGLSVRNLMEVVNGPVEVRFNGKSQYFENGEQAVSLLSGKYVVKAIYVKDGKLVTEIDNDITVRNNVNEDWVRAYEKETGESISFF